MDRSLDPADCLELQRARFRTNPVPDYKTRRARLDALQRLLNENRDAIVEAICQDYGSRSSFETLFTEFLVTLAELRHTRKHLRRWMKRRSRAVDVLLYPGAKNSVQPQPLGVIGVIVPWNFPLLLAFGPLISIFAAGNHAMVKMSENSRHLARLLLEITPRYFPVEQLCFFEDKGQGQLGTLFSSLPFDHLFFTGSARTGRAVMANAAAHLTPVTLELGGKSPAIVAPDFPIRTAAERILWAKLLNAGQICATVDTLYLPETQCDAFIEQALQIVAERYPDLDSPNYTALIDNRAYQRLLSLLEDAHSKGARLINLCPKAKPEAGSIKFPPHLVLNVTDDMQIMQQEIFGPLLPIRSYRDPQEVIEDIHRRDHPLALYLFTHDRTLQSHYLSHILSGGVSINDTLMHVSQSTLPFGGVGGSGMGHYHGHEGFLTFSKLRPVFRQGPFSAVQLLFQPPYRPFTLRLLNLLLRIKA